VPAGALNAPAFTSNGSTAGAAQASSRRASAKAAGQRSRLPQVVDVTPPHHRPQAAAVWQAGRLNAYRVNGGIQAAAAGADVAAICAPARTQTKKSSLSTRHTDTQSNPTGQA
jgi:hypothetical protein